MTGPPWLGTTALAALVTFGQVEWLVTAGFLLAVPLTWFLALRTLRGYGVEGPAAVIAALGYAVTPALVGALGGGWLGILTWAVALPLLVHSLNRWNDEGTWREAGAVALWLLVAVVELPLAWPLVLLVMAIGPAARSVRGIAQVALVAVSGALALGPALIAWSSFPGRFLTSASPGLADRTPPEAWQLVLAHPGGTSVAPLWVCGVVVGVAWLSALLGLFRRPRAALPGLIAAGIGLVAGIALSRLMVMVPPGVEARPQAQPWLILMVGGLVLAASRGLSGLAAELRDRTLGGWHTGAQRRCHQQHRDLVVDLQQRVFGQPRDRSRPERRQRWQRWRGLQRRKHHCARCLRYAHGRQPRQRRRERDSLREQQPDGHRDHRFDAEEQSEGDVRDRGVSWGSCEGQVPSHGDQFDDQVITERGGKRGRSSEGSSVNASGHCCLSGVARRSRVAFLWFSLTRT